MPRTAGVSDDDADDEPGDAAERRMTAPVPRPARPEPAPAPPPRAVMPPAPVLPEAPVIAPAAPPRNTESREEPPPPFPVSTPPPSDRVPVATEMPDPDSPRRPSPSLPQTFPVILPQPRPFDHAHATEPEPTPAHAAPAPSVPVIPPVHDMPEPAIIERSIQTAPEPPAHSHVPIPDRRPVIEPLPEPWLERPVHPASDVREPYVPPVNSDAADTLGEPPPIHISIGRIDVRATTPKPAPADRRATRSSEPAMSLADYLRRRTKGEM
jgi:hypothetical protein